MNRNSKWEAPSLSFFGKISLQHNAFVHARRSGGEKLHQVLLSSEGVHLLHSQNKMAAACGAGEAKMRPKAAKYNAAFIYFDFTQREQENLVDEVFWCDVVGPAKADWRQIGKCSKITCFLMSCFEITCFLMTSCTLAQR